jgi:gliding motility-associated-like protein
MSPYEISFESGAYTPVDLINLPVYTDLSHGFKDIKVRDVNNCVVEDDQALVGFPGYVNANILTGPPTCTGQGMDGKLSIFIDSAVNVNSPPYSFGVAYNTTPEEDVIMQPIMSNTIVIVDTLTNGDYYILLSSATACTASTDFQISGGPSELSFDLISISNASCKGGSGSVIIDNVTGDPSSDYLVELLSLPGLNPVYSVRLSSAELVDGYTIDGSVTDMFTAGDYQVRLSQDQSGCPITTTSQAFTILEPAEELDFIIVETTTSWPETPSGTITLHVQANGGDPYETSLETQMSYFPGQDIFRDWDYVEEIPGNPTVYEFIYEELYSGVYDVYVRDRFGCVVHKEATVNFERDIFIPNVFTPNGDSYNEDFFIRNLPPSGNTLIITNRWGKIVYQTDDYNYDNLWDGGNNPDATYYYKLDVPDKGTFTGWVEIWRGNDR